MQITVLADLLSSMQFRCGNYGKNMLIQTAEGCTKRWKALRDRFVRELKKTKTKTGQAGPVVISCWPLFNVLSFITDTVRHKRLAIIIHFQNN